MTEEETTEQRACGAFCYLYAVCREKQVARDNIIPAPEDSARCLQKPFKKLLYLRFYNNSTVADYPKNNIKQRKESRQDQISKLSDFENSL